MICAICKELSVWLSMNMQLDSSIYF